MVNLYADDHLVESIPEKDDYDDKNCRNCGAPFRFGHTHCEYCGTVRKVIKRKMKSEIVITADSIRMSAY